MLMATHSFMLKDGGGGDGYGGDQEGGIVERVGDGGCVNSGNDSWARVVIGREDITKSVFH